MKIFTKPVENRLKQLSIINDNIFCEEAIIFLNKKSKAKVIKCNKINYDRIVSQLPDGIYNNIKSVIAAINSNIKKNNTGATTYSPFIVDRNELKICKRIPYSQGHIITGRDVEIEKILTVLSRKHKRGVILVGEPGVGKVLPNSTLVLTPTGWVKNGSLEIGDKVIGADGLPTTVTNVFPHKDWKFYKITFSDGDNTCAGEEHLWSVKTATDRRKYKTSRIVSTGEMMRNVRGMDDRLNYSIDYVKPVNFDVSDITLKLDPWLLGAYIGDGCKEGYQFTNTETDIITKYKEKVESLGDTFKTVDHKEHLITGMNFKTLIRHYKLNVLSYEKMIPSDYLYASVEDRISLLQGLIDTDGSVNKDTSFIEYSTTSELLKTNVIHLVKSLGGSATYTKRIGKYKIGFLHIETRLSYRIIISFSNNIVPFSSDKHRSRYNNKRQRNVKYIEKIRYSHIEDGKCITVDNKDHLYVIEDFIVTHNTAIVEAINAMLINKNVPKNLVGSEIHNLDLSYVFSRFKDDPIGKMVKALDAASDDDKHILFIDEVHQLLTGKMNDTLKPYLTGKIKFIGSTTIDEYHAIVTEDKALERRFTIVDIREPSIEKTIKMLTGTKSIFEEYHKVSIPDDTIRYLVENGTRFMGHRKNPDKALDILDMSCTILNRNEVKVIAPLVNEGDGLDGLDNNRKSIMGMQTIPGERLLTIDYVDQGISAMTGINYGKIRNSLNYEYVSTKIKSKIFGQDESVDKLSNIVNIIKHVNLNRTRPLSIVLAIGGPGTGKASATKELAKLVYGSNESFVDFDLGQFKSDHQLSEIKGAPPGYVGYAKSGKFIKEIRNKPQSILYFRHTNKCNGIILDYLLDAIKKGIMVDSAEKEARLNNCMIVFSITLGEDEHKQLSRKGGMGFCTTPTDNLNYNEDSLKQIVSEDILNVVDSVIMFKKLEDDVLERIYDENITVYLEQYKDVVDLNTDNLKKDIMLSAKTGHDVITGLENKIPKLLFNKKLKG